MESSLDRDERIISLLAKARRLPPEQRHDYLRAECEHDSDLYRELAEALEWEDRMGQFLLDPLIDLTELVRPFEVGEIVNGRFEIVREIGEGGMGVVYEAFDRKRNLKIAIKAAKPGFQRLLSPELEGALRVRHRNICLVNHIDTAETKHGPVDFLTMELLDGETLTARLSREKRLPPEGALDIALQLCAGVAEAHRSGIIHRDLKTSNILLCPSEDGSCRAVITDFGLAGGLNLSSEFGGTPGYMAPELHLGGRASKASDIYALGVVFYEMITGQKPFDPAASDEVLAHRPAAPTTGIEGLDPKWDQAILPCLEPSPEARPSDATVVASLLRKKRIRKAPLVASLLALFVFLAGLAMVPKVRAWIIRIVRPSHSPHEVSTVILSDFVGDNRFDDALKTALSIQLEQSPSLNVLSDQKVAETLKLMDRSPTQPLTSEVAREVCLRTDGRAFLTSSVSDVGGHFLVAVKAVDCQTGETLASAETEAESQEKLLKGINEIGNQLRARLGGSLVPQGKFDKPLEEATTSSLEALQAFTRARKVQMTGEADPIPFFKRAVELDPNFAAAYTALGTAYGNMGQSTLAMQNYEKAYQLRDRVSERERVAIEGHYYDAVTGELEKANESYLEWIHTYPQEWKPHQNLSVNYLELGQYEKAKDEALEAIHLSGENVFPFVVLASEYNALDRPGDAQAAVQNAHSRSLEFPNLHLNQYVAAFLQGDDAAMRQELDWAMGKPGSEDMLLSAQADTESYYGRFGKARGLAARAVQSAQHAGIPETAAGWKAIEALREAEIGNTQAARKAADEALALAPGRDVSATAALALARAGDTARAQKLADNLDREFPRDTMVQNFSLPTIRASIELKKNNPTRAIDILTVTTPYEFGVQSFGYLYPAYVRGEAYLRAGEPQQAAAEFQKILDHPGITLNFVTAALTHLQLGRAQAMMGDKAAARRSYETFLAVWKGADADIRILQAAKAEYETLK